MNSGHSPTTSRHPFGLQIPGALTCHPRTGRRHTDPELCNGAATSTPCRAASRSVSPWTAKWLEPDKASSFLRGPHQRRGRARVAATHPQIERSTRARNRHRPDRGANPDRRRQERGRASAAHQADERPSHPLAPSQIGHHVQVWDGMWDSQGPCLLSY